MIVLQTIAVAFAMFSAIPVPQFDWNEKNMRYTMCAFPLIGAVIGAAWCVCGALPLPGLAKAAGFALVPVWVTGGIHLDGYADTCDALSSYGDRTKKAGNIKRPPLRRLCGHSAVQLLSGDLCPVHLRAVHPRAGCCGCWRWCWNGHFRAMRWRHSPWRKTPVLRTPLPLRQTKPWCAGCWRRWPQCCAWAWRRWAAGHWCWQRWRCSGATML